MSKEKLPQPKFKAGDLVEDVWYPDWGTGQVLSVLKTRYKIKYPGAPEYLKDKNGNVTFDTPHANQFLRKVEEKKNSCDWAVEGMRVRILRTDIQPLHKKNKTKEGIISRIDGGYIYVKPLYESKHTMELYIHEIAPGKGYKNAKKEWDDRFNKALICLKKVLKNEHNKNK